MTFLNPLALLGLITAVVPLIIHLLNLRKLKKIEFSTLAFLKELQKSQIRRLKLRQLLLLIIRTLMIIFIVLAFSRPALKGTLPGKIAQHAASTIVIIFDDSYSMSVQDENGEYFKQAKNVALSILDIVNVEDEVHFIKLSDIESSESLPANNKSILRQVINESKISEVHNSMNEALKFTSKLLSKSKNANKEVYIISDLQKTCFDLNTKDKNEIFSSDVKFFVINIGEKEISNAGIDTLDIQTKIFEQNKPVVISLLITNYGNSDISNLVASLYLNGLRSVQKSVDIKAWGSTSVEFITIPKNFGFIKGYIELESDPLEIDNRRYFSLYIPEKISVLLVSANEENSKFIKLALNTNSLFSYITTSIDKLSSENLANYDAMILLDIKNLSTDKISRIKNFVNSGGGLLIFPDSEDNLSSINQLAVELGFTPADGFLKTATGLTFEKVDFNHPVFSGVFQEDNKRRERELSSPQIYLSLKLKSSVKANQIITLSGGYPFLQELKAGEGKVLLFAVSANLNWSDFPLKGIFAPLIYRSISYSTTSNVLSDNRITGEVVKLKVLRKEFIKPKLKLIYPDGNEEIINITEITQENDRAKFVNIGKLNYSGIYEINDDNKTIGLISINTNRLESDLRKISTDDLYEYFDKFGVMKERIEILKSSSDMKSTIMASRFGTELWKLALIIVIVLALLEMLIAADRKKDMV